MTSARPTILFVTSGLLCRSPRVLKAATTLGEIGYDVTVLTSANVGAYERFDQEILQTAPFRRQTVDRLSRDWRTRLGSLNRRARTWLARWALQAGREREAAFGPVSELRRLAEAHRAALTIVHTEQGFMVGAALLRSGRKVATDFEDWHSRDLLPAAQRGRPLQLLRRRERELLRGSVFSTTTSTAMATALARGMDGSPPLVLRNVFPLQPNPRRIRPAAIPSLLWFSQTVGPGRMLELFVAAWRDTTQPSRLCLLGVPRAGYREKLVARVPADRRWALEFLDLVSPSELPGLIAEHDLGLALEPSIPDNKDLTISNKIFQYLNAGLGVIATPTAGQREVLGLASAAGLLVDLTQTRALTRQLDALLANPAARTDLGLAARRAAEQHYCWEKESPVLVAAVAAVLGAP